MMSILPDHPYLAALAAIFIWSEGPLSASEGLWDLNGVKALDLLAKASAESWSWRYITGKALLATLALVVILGLWQATRLRWPVKIVVANGKVLAHQGVAKAQVAKVVQFLEHDVALTDRVTIRAGRTHNGVLKMNVTGNVDAGTKQQMRNFLMMVV